MLKSNVAVSEALDKRFASAQGLYGSLEDIPLIAQKGHYRRMELLEGLAIGNIADKVCADFGTGSWGFADVYPRLHMCKRGYGLDISPTALSQSAARTGERPYGDKITYLQSDGLELPLPDTSVDLIFAGEAIEHVRLPQRFLSECYRVLRVGGQLILTTPNRDALLYRIQFDQYCVGPEHFWLFNLSELVDAVAEFFDVEECMGFNGSIYRDLDREAKDAESTEKWAHLFHREPENGSGIVLRARKSCGAARRRYAMTSLDGSVVRRIGPHQMLDLEFGLKGTMIDSVSSLIRFACPPCAGLVTYFWTHRWSGYTGIRCGEDRGKWNLWSRDPGWKPIHWRFTDRVDRTVEISWTGERDSRALNSQVIFFEAFVYDN